MISMLSLAAALSISAAAESSHRFFVSTEENRVLDTRTLAERVVARIRAECDLAGEPSVAERPVAERPVAEGADIILMAPGELLAKIAKEGFLNSHVTGTTKGFHADRFALEQELAMARLPYDDKGKRLLPKYAVVDLAGADVGKFPLPTRYGEVAFVMKPDVASRATWTYADSLDFGARVGRFTPAGDANPVLPRTFEYRRKPKDQNRCVNYCEAQIWGELDLRDVAYAMVPGRSAPSALKRAGVRVYRYSMPASSTTIVAPDRAAQYTRGDLLFKGEPAKISGPEPAAARAAPTEEALYEIWNSTRTQERAVALYELSALPWPRFKPYVFAALADPKPLIATSGVAFASEHLDDADIVRAVKWAARTHQLDRELGVVEWIERLDKRRFCD